MSNKDFDIFKQTGDSKTPEKLDNQILSYVQSDLNPNGYSVLSKLVLIHAVIGIATLTFCPQFNFSLTNNYDLFHYLHYKFGMIICTAICAIIFMGSGAIFASFLLSRGELKKIHSYAFSYFGLATIVAIIGLYFVGSSEEILLTIIWAISAYLSSIVLFRIVKSLRIIVLKY